MQGGLIDATARNRGRRRPRALRACYPTTGGVARDVAGRHAN